MKLIRKMMVLCTILIFTICFLSGTAYAVEETDEPADDIIDIINEYVFPIIEETVPVYEIEPVIETEIPPEDLFTIPDGTGTVIETATGEDGRVFYTISTPAGNIFYLIIDHSRQANNVYFLNAVTERDLLALAVNSDDWNTSVSAIPDMDIDNTPPIPEQIPDIQVIPEQESNGNPFSNIILVVVMVLIGIGAGVYFYYHRKSKNDDSGNEYENDLPDSYNDYDIENGNMLDDDTPPWDDDVKIWGDK